MKVVQKIKNAIGDLLGYGRCFLCDRTLFMEETGDYHGRHLICSRCKYDVEVVRSNLRYYYKTIPELRAISQPCPRCRVKTMFRFEVKNDVISYDVYAICSKCGFGLIIDGDIYPEVKQFIKQQKEKMHELKWKIYDLGVPVVGGFFRTWDYSETYTSNFRWADWKDAERRVMRVEEVIQYIQKIKDDIEYVQLGSEGHYSICKNYVFLKLKDGRKIVINVEPYFHEDLIKVAKNRRCND